MLVGVNVLSESLLLSLFISLLIASSLSWFLMFTLLIERKSNQKSNDTFKIHLHKIWISLRLNKNDQFLHTCRSGCYNVPALSNILSLSLTHLHQVLVQCHRDLHTRHNLVSNIKLFIYLSWIRAKNINLEARFQSIDLQS